MMENVTSLTMILRDGMEKIINVEKTMCIYCHKDIYPMIETNQNEIRKRCPKCAMTLEVIKRGRK